MEEFKQRQRAMWAAGDYVTLSEYISDMGELVVERAGVESGMRMLDVACSPGNAAFPAAPVGARVTGLDLVPELLNAGRRKAGSEGVEIEWVEGDAEDLHSGAVPSIASSPPSGTCSPPVTSGRRTRWLESAARAA